MLFRSNPTMYWICAIGSFILFFLDIIFEFLVMSYVHNHGYNIIHINMACILLLFLSLGAFVGVCTLYTICLSENSYHHIRHYYMYFEIGYLAMATLYLLWLLFFESSDKAAFNLLIIPVLVQFVLVGAITYTFYEAYTPVKQKEIYVVSLDSSIPKQPMMPAMTPMFDNQPFPVQMRLPTQIPVIYN